MLLIVLARVTAVNPTLRQSFRNRDKHKCFMIMILILDCFLTRVQVYSGSKKTAYLLASLACLPYHVPSHDLRIQLQI